MTHPDARSLGAPLPYTPQFDRAPLDAVDHAPWSLSRLLAFRFTLIYLLLYTFPGPVQELPWTDWLGNSYGKIWKAVVPWFGAHVLRLGTPISIRPSGSGDKLFDWVQIAAMLTIALIGAAIWSAVARRHRSHPKLFAAFQLYLRFTLASILFGYGFDKVVPNQFEQVNPVRLTQYIGEAAPGGLAWSFLGFSVMYEVFAGIGEVVAGLLLLFRRTTTLGAIVGTAVMTNVFMLNMSYDIPVKQYSFHLLLMCLALVACDAPRLLNVLVLQRAAAARRYTELFTTPKALRIARVVGAMLIVWMIGGHLYGELKGYRQFGRGAPKGPLYGIFEVDEMTRNGVVQPPLLTDATRWRRLAASNRGGTIRMASDSVVRFRLQADSIKHVATLTLSPDTTVKAVLAYAFPDPAHLVLNGTIGKDSVVLRLRRRSEQSYLLVSRGFHWVNEIPYFR